jgi:hypothetical protein
MLLYFYFKNLNMTPLLIMGGSTPTDFNHIPTYSHLTQGDYTSFYSHLAQGDRNEMMVLDFSKIWWENE